MKLFLYLLLLVVGACKIAPKQESVTLSDPGDQGEFSSEEDELLASFDEVNRELFDTLGSIAADPDSAAGKELEARSAALTSKSEDAEALFSKASPSLLAQLEKRQELFDDPETNNEMLALTDSEERVVAGQTLSGAALAGHMAIRYGTGGMLTKPGLFDEGLLLHIANKVWPKSLTQGRTFKSTRDPQLWAAAAKRYGLVPESEAGNFPYGFTRALFKKRETFFLNCYACHIGNVRDKTGKKIPWLGAPNQEFNLGQIMSDLTSASAQRVATLHIPDAQVGSYTYFLLEPLPKGQSAAVFLGWFLASARTPDMLYKPTRLMTGKSLFNVLKGKEKLPLGRHFVPGNVPPWWWVRGPYIYSDGTVKRDSGRAHYALAQMYMSPGNTSEFLRSPSFANSMKSIFALVNAVRPPVYPGSVSKSVAERGADVFARNCATCHDSGRRANVGTDPVLARSFAEFGPMFAKLRWFSDMKVSDLLYPSADSASYRAMPLTAVWTRSLALHNASIPLAWMFRKVTPVADAVIEVRDIHNPATDADLGPSVRWVARPKTEGITPSAMRTRLNKMLRYIDPARRGGSFAGHPYSRLKKDGGLFETTAEQEAVIEYLKVRCAKENSLQNKYDTCFEGVDLKP